MGQGACCAAILGRRAVMIHLNNAILMFLQFLKILIIFLFFTPISYAQKLIEKSVIIKDEKIQTPEELTKELAAQKKAAEPFDPKDIKIDVHTLGLDDVDDKKSSQNATIKQNKNGTVNAAQNSGNFSQKDLDDKTSQVQTEQNLKVFDKIQKIFKKNKKEEEQTAQSQPVIVATDLKKSNSRYVKLLKKQKLRARIAQEKKNAKTLREKQRLEEKENRLVKLREEYLIKLDEENPSNPFLNEGEFLQDDAEIVPQEKNLSWSQRFLTYDAPPAPILDRYRGNENKHIPIIPTAGEKIDLLFRIITSKADGNPAAFHEAYQYILDPDITNDKGETILTYATILQKYSIMSSILGKGADPDLPNVLGHTPLDIAIEMNDLKACKILLDMNADVNYIDGFDRTYLMHAARSGFLPIVDLLVANKANVNAVDKEGFTALTVAAKHKKDVIAKYLSKHGAIMGAVKSNEPQDQSLMKELENRWQ